MSAETRALIKIRDQIESANRQLSELTTSSLSEDETVERIDQFINQQAALVSCPDKEFLNRETMPSGIFIPLVNGRANVAPLMCKFFPDQFRNHVRRGIDSSNIPFGFSDSELHKKRLELNDLVFALEQKEEAQIVKMKSAGIPCHRRPDVSNPLVIALKKVS